MGNISPKKEGINKKVMHIEKCIDNVISAAMTEQTSKKVLEMKKENIMEKGVKEFKTENNSLKIELKKDDEKSKTLGKRKLGVKNKTEEEKKQTEEEKKRKSVNMDDNKIKLEEEKRKKSDDKKKAQPKIDTSFESSKS